MFERLRKKVFLPPDSDREHKSVQEQLDRHERELRRQAQQLRKLEIEAGIFNPHLREVNGP